MSSRVDDIQLRTARLTARASVREEAGEIDFVLATANPVRMLDWERYEEVDEILLGAGAEPFPEQAPLLDTHDRDTCDSVIGSWRAFRRSGDDVIATARFDLEDDKGRRTFGKYARGHLTDVSVGYRVREATYIPAGRRAEVQGRSFEASPDRPLKVATRWEIREGSACPIGADVMAKKRAAWEQARAERRSEMAEQPTTAAPNGDQPIREVDLTSVREEAARAERERISAIRQRASAIDGLPQEIVTRAISDGVTPDEASTLILEWVSSKRSQPLAAHDGTEMEAVPSSAPYTFARGSYNVTPQQALRDLGFGLRHAIGAPVKPISELVQEAQADYDRRSRSSAESGSGPLAPRKFGISDQARGLPGSDKLATKDYERSAEEGYRCRGFEAVDFLREGYEIATGKRAPRAKSEAIRAFFGLFNGLETRAAGVSTADLANVFTDSVSAQLIAGYELASDTTVFCREADVADFRTQERPRALAINPMGKLPLSGALAAPFNSMNDTVESYKAARYADQFAFDERMFIDDRLDLLSSIPFAMGQNAAQVRPDLVYYILLNGSSAGLAAGAIFSSGNNNYDASSATLTSANLQSAISDMRKQTETSPDGSTRNLNIEPTFLVTAQANRWSALELINSTLIVVAGSTDTVRGASNPLVGALTVVSDSRFDNGVTDPASGSAASADSDGWALIAAQRYPTIEVGYVRATGRAPVIRPYMLDRGAWGMGWDCKLDIGAKALDFRGMYYSKGA